MKNEKEIKIVSLGFSSVYGSSGDKPGEKLTARRWERACFAFVYIQSHTEDHNASHWDVSKADCANKQWRKYDVRIGSNISKQI